MEILNYEKYLKSKLINFTVINDNNRLLCVIKNNAYIDLKNFEFSIK